MRPTKCSIHSAWVLAWERNSIPFPFKTHAHRLELHSPEFQFFQEVRELEDTKTDSKVAQEASWEGWDCKLLLFGFGSKHDILAQEIFRP